MNEQVAMKRISNMVSKLQLFGFGFFVWLGFFVITCKQSIYQTTMM